MTTPEPITHARVLRIAVPIVLANMTVPLQGVADTAVIGQIPDATPLAAVAVARLCCRPCCGSLGSCGWGRRA